MKNLISLHWIFLFHAIFVFFYLFCVQYIFLRFLYYFSNFPTLSYFYLTNFKIFLLFFFPYYSFEIISSFFYLKIFSLSFINFFQHYIDINWIVKKWTLFLYKFRITFSLWNNILLFFYIYFIILQFFCLISKFWFYLKFYISFKKSFLFSKLEKKREIRNRWHVIIW